MTENPPTTADPGSLEKQNKQEVPSPFGGVVDPSEWRRMFTQILKYSPWLNLFDGEQDMSSRLLDISTMEDISRIIVIDEILPDYSRDLLRKNKTLLARFQYFEGGLHHRISFHGFLDRIVKYKGKPAFELRVTEPLQRVSNIYISYTSGKQPVYLEVPVAGAPPEVRVVELSAKKMIAQSPGLNRLFPRPQNINGMRVQVVDLGEAVVNGKVQAAGEEDIEVNLDPMNDEAGQVFSDYLGQVFAGEREREHENLVESIKQSEGDKGNVPGSHPGTAADSSNLCNSLVLCSNQTICANWGGILSDLGYPVERVSSVLDVDQELFGQSRLVVLSDDINGTHAVDVLKGWKKTFSGEFPRFIITGENIAKARTDEWGEIGMGLFIRPNAKPDWIKRHIANWMKSDRVVNRVVLQQSNVLLPKVLSVIQNKPERRKLSTLMKANQIRVEELEEVNEVVNTAARLKPGMIILNLELPIMYSLGIVKTIRQTSGINNIPVFLISSKVDPEYITEAKKFGVVDFIIKPYDEHDLLARLRRALDM